MKSAGVIIYNTHTGRYEFWRESRCEAHSNVLDALTSAYPRAAVSIKSEE